MCGDQNSHISRRPVTWAGRGRGETVDKIYQSHHGFLGAHECITGSSDKGGLGQAYLRSPRQLAKKPFSKSWSLLPSIKQDEKENQHSVFFREKSELTECCKCLM